MSYSIRISSKLSNCFIKITFIQNPFLSRRFQVYIHSFSNLVIYLLKANQQNANISV
jgi:hypothetical protein